MTINKEMTSKNCLNMEYTLLKGMYLDHISDIDNYILCTSEVIDDYFWNIAYVFDKLKVGQKIN